MPAALVRFGIGAEPYTPPCLKLFTGGYVMFEGPFRDHPLQLRPLGTRPSPIDPTADGGAVAFDFFDFGFYPYQCAKHPDEMGVVWASWY